VDQDLSKEKASSFNKSISQYTPYSDVRFSEFDEDIMLSMDEIKKLKFNRLTTWNLANKELSEIVLEFGAFNGYDIEEIHNRGITGIGVNVAIIDQNLAGEHPEFQGKIIEYHDMGWCRAPLSRQFFHRFKVFPQVTLPTENLLLLRKIHTSFLASSNLEIDETVLCCRTQNIS